MMMRASPTPLDSYNKACDVNDIAVTVKPTPS
jgi:hypothetical protein